MEKRHSKGFSLNPTCVCSSFIPQTSTDTILYPSPWRGRWQLGCSYLHPQVVSVVRFFICQMEKMGFIGRCNEIMDIFDTQLVHKMCKPLTEGRLHVMLEIFHLPLRVHSSFYTLCCALEIDLYGLIRLPCPLTSHWVWSTGRPDRSVGRTRR